MATKNIFACLDSDDEEPVVQQTPTTTTTKVTATKKVVPTAKVLSRDYVKEHKRVDKRDGRGNPSGASIKGRRRDHDRKSGTGRGRENSKRGGGAHNWGSEKNAVDLAAEGGISSKAVQDNIESDEQPEGSDEIAVEEEEEEDNEMSLDEYLAQKELARCGEQFAAIEVRRVKNEFSDAALIVKEGKTPDFIESNFERVYQKKTSGRKKQMFEGVGFRTAPSADSENRRFKGNENRRGGFNNGGGRRGGFNGSRRGRVHVPNVSDMKAFPTLS